MIQSLLRVQKTTTTAKKYNFFSFNSFSRFYRERKEFLHDLRTPFMSLKGTISLLWL
jgi:hypothetical protein